MVDRKEREQERDSVLMKPYPPPDQLSDRVVDDRSATLRRPSFSSSAEQVLNFVSDIFALGSITFERERSAPDDRESLHVVEF